MSAIIRNVSAAPAAKLPEPKEPDEDAIAIEIRDDVKSGRGFTFPKVEPMNPLDYQQIIIIDGLPCVNEEKLSTFTKLLYRNVISKCTDDPEVKAIEKNNKNHYYIPVNKETGTSLGYCFVRFARVSFARNCISLFNGQTPFGESYPLSVYTYKELLENSETCQTEFQEPERTSIPGFENRLDWLDDPRARSQFLIHSAQNEVDGLLGSFYYDEITPPEHIFNRKLTYAAQTNVAYTHNGSFISFLNAGKNELRIALASNTKINFVLKHQNVEAFLVSPCERFAVTIARTGKKTERPVDETGTPVPDDRLDAAFVSCIDLDIYEIRLWSIWEQRIISTFTSATTSMAKEFDFVKSFRTIDGDVVDYTNNLVAFSGNSNFLMVRRPTGFRTYRITMDQGVYSLNPPEVFTMSNIIDIAFAGNKSSLLAIFQGVRQNENRPCNVMLMNLNEKEENRVVCSRSFHVESGYFVWQQKGHGLAIITEQRSKATFYNKCFVFRLSILYDRHTGRYLPYTNEGRKTIKQFLLPGGGGYNIPVETFEIQPNIKVVSAEWSEDAKQLAFATIPDIKQSDQERMDDEALKARIDSQSAILILTLNEDLSKTYSTTKIPGVVANQISYSPSGNYLVAVTKSDKKARITFINTKTAEIVADHDSHPLDPKKDTFGITDYAWDPTGRFLATWFSTENKVGDSVSFSSDIILYNCFGVPRITNLEAFKQYNTNFILNFVWRPLDKNLTELTESDEAVISRVYKSEKSRLEVEDEKFVKKIQNEALEKAKERITEWEKRKRIAREAGREFEKAKIRALRECYDKFGYDKDYSGYNERNEQICPERNPELYQKISAYVEIERPESSDSCPLKTSQNELSTGYSDKLKCGYKHLD